MFIKIGRSSQLALRYSVLLLFGMPVAAYADVGTPLMWTNILYLTILNLFIGLFESNLLVKRYQSKKLRSNMLLILANYFSAFVGAYTLLHLWQPIEQLFPRVPPLLKAGPILFALILGSWAMSVVLEWAFIALAMEAKPADWKKSIGASLFVQTASYILLVGFYLLVSPISIVTAGRPQESLRFVKQPLATVLYINPQDGSLWQIQTDGSNQSEIMSLTKPDPDDRLFVRNNAKSKLYDLYDLHIGSDQVPIEMAALHGIGAGCAASWHALQNSGDEEFTWVNLGPAADLRAPSDRYYSAETGFWASEGITIFRGKASNLWDKERVQTLAFDTPFDGWFCRNATVLPTDQVVLQLTNLKQQRDSSHIVILDLHTGKIGFLAYGLGPVVVMDFRSPKPATSAPPIAPGI